jgi:hypothetical protein
MTSLTRLRGKVTNVARTQADRYSGDAYRPLRGYAITMTVYASVVTALAAVVKLTRDEPPDGMSPSDIVLCAAATHKLSRLLAKDPVTSPLRAPFTEFRGTEGPSELAEDVRDDGQRKALGELITCPFCTGVWVTTGFASGLLLLPRTTRFVMGALTALAGADLLHFAHARLDPS